MIELITGEVIESKLSFVSKSATPSTRSFRVEAKVPNSKGLIRDGITGNLKISTNKVLANKISPSIMLLSDNGIIGVRIVQNNIVKFLPVKIIEDTQDGIWVSGIPNLSQLIVRGQGYVENGRKARIEIMVNPDAVDFGCYDYYGTELSDGTFLYEYFENWAADNGYKGQGYAEPSPSGESVNLYINIPLINDKGRAVRALNYATLFLKDANFKSLYKMKPEQVGLGHAILKIEDCK